MSNDAPSRPPRTLDREAVERVLQRATSLQARADGPRAQLLDETAVYEAAAELGLAPEIVRRALLEERAAGAPVTETQLATWLAGPGTVTVSRFVPGDRHTTLAVLEEWMHRQECLGPGVDAPTRSSGRRARIGARTCSGRCG
jgi:hypothetical protein